MLSDAPKKRPVTAFVSGTTSLSLLASGVLGLGTVGLSTVAAQSALLSSAFAAEVTASEGTSLSINDQTETQTITAGDTVKAVPTGLAYILPWDMTVTGSNGETVDDIGAAKNQYGHMYFNIPEDTAAGTYTVAVTDGEKTAVTQIIVSSSFGSVSMSIKDPKQSYKSESWLVIQTQGLDESDWEAAIYLKQGNTETALEAQWGTPGNIPGIVTVQLPADLTPGEAQLILRPRESSGRKATVDITIEETTLKLSVRSTTVGPNGQFTVDVSGATPGSTLSFYAIKEGDSRRYLGSEILSDNATGGEFTLGAPQYTGTYRLSVTDDDGTAYATLIVSGITLAISSTDVYAHKTAEVRVYGRQDIGDTVFTATKDEVSTPITATMDPYDGTRFTLDLSDIDAGTYTLTATENGESSSATLTVQPEPDAITLEVPTKTLKGGNTYTVRVTGPKQENASFTLVHSTGTSLKLAFS
ncbi:MAG: hypothetical protein Q3976_10335, partial [Corynebacterium sp.]|nr:hypothetical protein [Corynebacterium sp.]